MHKNDGVLSAFSFFLKHIKRLGPPFPFHYTKGSVRIPKTKGENPHSDIKTNT